MIQNKYFHTFFAVLAMFTVADLGQSEAQEIINDNVIIHESFLNSVFGPEPEVEINSDDLADRTTRLAITSTDFNAFFENDQPSARFTVFNPFPNASPYFSIDGRGLPSSPFFENGAENPFYFPSSYTEIVQINLDALPSSLTVDRGGDVGVSGVRLDEIRADLHVKGDFTETSMLFEDLVGQRDWEFIATENMFELGTRSTAMPFGSAANGFDIEAARTRGIFSVAGLAPAGSLHIEDNGDIGAGTTIPDAALHVLRDDGTASLKVENDSASVSNRTMFELTNNGGVFFALDNTDTGERWDMSNNSVGDFSVSRTGTGGPEMRVTRAGRLTSGPAGFNALDSRPSGNLFIAGTLFESSDREKKENFEDVDCEAILEEIEDLSITTWNYKSDEEEIRHMGPVAQDFRSAFELGDSDKTIATTDKIGVSLAAIKALSAKLRNKDGEITTLQAELQDVNERMKRLEEMVEQAALRP